MKRVNETDQREQSKDIPGTIQEQPGTIRNSPGVKQTSLVTIVKSLSLVNYLLYSVHTPDATS